MEHTVSFENRHFRLVISETGMVKSLFCKDTGQECLAGGPAALCAVTQSRYFNNENKLANPTKQVTLQANSVRREGNRLVIGFEMASYEAVLEVKEEEHYISFKLADFNVPEEKVASSDMDLSMDKPALEAFRILQLPVKNREKFGSWLGVMWDDDTAVSILATTPETLIDSEEQNGLRVMTAEARQETRIKGAEAVLIVTKTPEFLDAVDVFEQDYDLPRGVQARRSREIRCSYFAARTVNPATIDEQIEICKKGGFRHLLVPHNSIFNYKVYDRCGDYDEDNFHPAYVNGMADMKAMVKKIRDAGIIPGLHFLHTHIGLQSRYVTPRADHRLNLKRHFTLSRPMGTEETVIYVEQDPRFAPMADGCRILQFGGELIAYEGYSSEERCFTGCTRGYLETEITEHPLGQIGGVLDVSEFGATSCHIDQETSLQDEIAEKIARIYNLGFEFIYFDGSEGTDAPFACNVADAQWKVWKKLQMPPTCSEGAAKSHFSWHMLPGGNAFDVFSPDIFKEMIREHPAAEAKRLQMDFTRLNFGWWALYPDLQPDHWEYGCCIAAAWDCPVSVSAGRTKLQAHPKTDDLLEVLRRWEDVRVDDLLSPEQKKAIRENPEQERILLINEQKQYELCDYDQIPTADESIRAFLFERKGSRYVVFWHTTGEGSITLPAGAEVYDELFEAPVCYADGVAPASHRRYWKTDLSREQILDIFK